MISGRGVTVVAFVNTCPVDDTCPTLVFAGVVVFIIPDNIPVIAFENGLTYPAFVAGMKNDKTSETPLPA